MWPNPQKTYHLNEVYIKKDFRMVFHSSGLILLKKKKLQIIWTHACPAHLMFVEISWSKNRRKYVETREVGLTRETVEALRY